jgi:hypothetical protein
MLLFARRKRNLTCANIYIGIGYDVSYLEVLYRGPNVMFRLDFSSVDAGQKSLVRKQAGRLLCCGLWAVGNDVWR